MEKSKRSPNINKWNRKEAPDYRPVSLTRIPYKVMGKVIRLRIIEDLGRINIVTNGQHGFRRRKSCLTDLIELYDKVTKMKQKREGWVDCIFPRLSKKNI